jgi:type I restriction enzyme M protein
MASPQQDGDASRLPEVQKRQLGSPPPRQAPRRTPAGSGSAMKDLTDPKESATRKRIDAILRNLKWSCDESAPDCNIFTERPKTRVQARAVAPYEPDYVLYQSGTDTPIAVIEAKRSGESLSKALKQAVDLYAKPLGVHIVFVADGAIVESFDIRSGRGLRLDGDLVTNLLTEKQLLRHVHEGADITTSSTVRHTKQELIRVFSEANDLLRKQGLREGIERFTEFSNLLFLKLISEIEEDREQAGGKRILEKRYCWPAFADKAADDMLDYINDTILPRLVNKYNHSGDVFQSRLLITNADTLKRIVTKLSALRLLDADSDIKGDAFEYFLKNSISVGNDLGEYFTPRHIVKLMVDLVDPRYGDTVYDPACGTGGFLIQAFRHIKGKVHETAKSLRVLKEDTIYGRELTGTAKIAKMNMIIIGDGHTNIKQMDSLAAPVKKQYDVVLTNYPFSQQTDFSSYYDLETENANPVFLKHVIDALKVGGRAGVVVPEGVLFDSSVQFAKVRRILLESCDLEAVVNLHEYVFRPYTGQPTSILIFVKGRPTKKTWFFEVKQDGYEKSIRQHGRRPSQQNDLTLLRQAWNDRADTDRSFSVDIDTIKAHDYKLTIDEYRSEHAKSGWVSLGGKNGICDIVIGGTPSTTNRQYYGGNNLWVKIKDLTRTDGMYVYDTEEKITDAGVENSSVKLIRQGTLLLSFKLSLGKVAIAGHDLYTNEAIAALIPRDGRALPKYLYYVLPRLTMSGARKAAKGQTSSKGRLAKMLVPLPPLNVQRDIIRELDEREKMIRDHRQEITRIATEVDGIIDEYIST